MSPLVGVADLAAHPEWRRVDCRHDLTNPAAGAAAYTDGHLPNAVFMHLDDDLSGPRTGRNGRHPLPAPERLAARLGELGISRDTVVVAYDAGPGMYAARLWWLLRWLGHERAAVLDGGLRAWSEAAQPLTQIVPTPAATLYHAQLSEHMRVAVDSVLNDFVNAPPATRGLLLDARAPDRYAGQNETLDPVAGHIPGAVNRFFQHNLNPNTLRFKPPEQLRAEYTALLGNCRAEGVIHQCGSGVTACHNLLAMEIAGLPGSRLYAGSWSEWCADPARPVATGP